MWAIDIISNSKGFSSCCGSFLQFYDFNMLDGELTFEMKRQLDVQETILSVKCSPDMKFVAVGLMDSTIKVFFMDTLKLHLAMYGHSLPVLSVDISSDSSLLVSCSSDKMVRVWGMDFGDCHCSMVHTEGLVGCQFLERTHHVISMAKETLNIYDADIHQRIQTVKVSSVKMRATHAYLTYDAHNSITIFKFTLIYRRLMLKEVPLVLQRKKNSLFPLEETKPSACFTKLKR